LPTSARDRANRGIARDRLDDIGFSASRRRVQSAPEIGRPAIPRPATDAAQMHALLEEKRRRLARRGGDASLLTAFYNTESEVDRIIDVLRGARVTRLTVRAGDLIIRSCLS